MLNLATKKNKKTQQNIFTKAIAQNDAAVKTTFIVAKEIAPTFQVIFRGFIYEAVHAEGV